MIQFSINDLESLHLTNHLLYSISYGLLFIIHSSFFDPGQLVGLLIVETLFRYRNHFPELLFSFFRLSMLSGLLFSHFLVVHVRNPQISQRFLVLVESTGQTHLILNNSHCLGSFVERIESNGIFTSMGH